MSRDWFVMLPGEMFDQGHVPLLGAARATYLCLLARMDRETRRVRFRYAALAQDLGRSEKTVQRHLNDLVRGGYITLQKRQYHTEVHVLEIPSRPDISVQSEHTPDRTFLSSLKNSEWTFLSFRPDISVQSLNRKWGPDVCPDTPRGGDKDTVATPAAPPNVTNPAPPPPEIGFLKFANKIHGAVHGVRLLPDPGDLARVRGLCESGIPHRVLKVAWLLFQRDVARPYLRWRPRTLALFCKPDTLNDYLGPAAKRLGEAKRRRMERGRAPDTAGDLLAVHAASSPEAGRMWARMLDWLQPRTLPENFQTWFEPVWAAGVTDAALTLVCPNRFYAKCLNENYLDLIVEAMRTVDAVPRRVVFTVTGDPDFKIIGGGGDSQKINRSGRASEPRMGRIDGEDALAGVPSPSPAVSRKLPWRPRNPAISSEPKQR